MATAAAGRFRSTPVTMLKKGMPEAKLLVPSSGIQAPETGMFPSAMIGSLVLFRHLLAEYSAVSPGADPAGPAAIAFCTVQVCLSDEPGCHPACRRMRYAENAAAMRPCLRQ